MGLSSTHPVDSVSSPGRSVWKKGQSRKRVEAEGEHYKRGEDLEKKKKGMRQKEGS